MLPSGYLDSIFGIVTRLYTGWTVQCLNPSRSKRFGLLQNIQIGSGAHPASYPRGTRIYFPRIKDVGCKVEHSPPSSQKVKK
jgi:hypothetical protein